jgi:hypothetical protein
MILRQIYSTTAVTHKLPHTGISSTAAYIPPHQYIVTHIKIPPRRDIINHMTHPPSPAYHRSLANSPSPVYSLTSHRVYQAHASIFPSTGISSLTSNIPPRRDIINHITLHPLSLANSPSPVYCHSHHTGYIRRMHQYSLPRVYRHSHHKSPHIGISLTISHIPPHRHIIAPS